MHWCSFLKASIIFRRCQLMSRESGVFCHGTQTSAIFETKISTYASTSWRILLCYLKNHILYFGEEKMGKRERSNWITTSCWHLMKILVRNDWKIKRGIDCNSVFSQKIFQFSADTEPFCEAKSWACFDRTNTHGGKRGYGGVWLRVVDSFSFLVGKKRRAFIPRRPLRGTQVLFICWLWQYSPHCVLFVHWMPEVLCSEVSAFSPLSNWMICLVKKKEPVYISCMPVPKYTCFYFI